MEELFCSDEEYSRCRKHPSQPRTGVCPTCLRNRLIRLCPECANERPCGCCASCSSSSSSSSFSSLFSFEVIRSGASTTVGSVGRVSQLIESEPAFQRSRSVGFHLLRQRSDTSGHAGLAQLQPPRGKSRPWFWPFTKGKEEEAAKRAVAAVRLSRSRTVGVPTGYLDSGRFSGGGDLKRKDWNWHFPSPMKAFRLRKSAKVVQARSPLCTS